MPAESASKTSIHPDAECEVILAAQAGDRAAFKALYERYRDRIYNLIYYSIGDILTAEDVLQIVFLKVYRALPRFRFESRFSTWLYRVTLNECINQSRGRAWPHVPFEALLGTGEEIDPRVTPDYQHAAGERREIVREAVMGLPSALRSVVILRYLDELSYEEIAETLNCPVGTVASRLNRALTRLERQLRPLRSLM
jgi:RNA polymerase sigma-70 factor (ECF subfamily)